MRSDADIEQLFATVRDRVSQATGGSSTGVGSGILGCALMLLPIVGVGGLALQYPRPGLEWALAAAFVIAAICFIPGAKLWGRWSRTSTALTDATNDTLPQLIELLMPGGILGHPTVATAQYHESLLLEPASARTSRHATIEGRLAGLPVVLEEVRSDFDSNVAHGWHLRFELPFAVDGHLRIRVPKTLEARVWKRDFERLPEATARRGARYVIDLAPRGSGPEPKASGDSAGYHPDVLLTDEVFKRLRVSGDIAIAAAERTLWVVVPRPIRVFHGLSEPNPAEMWKQAARALNEVEDIVSALLAPLVTRR